MKKTEWQKWRENKAAIRRDAEEMRERSNHSQLELDRYTSEHLRHTAEDNPFSFGHGYHYSKGKK